MPSERGGTSIREQTRRLGQFALPQGFKLVPDVSHLDFPYAKSFRTAAPRSTAKGIRSQDRRAEEGPNRCDSATDAELRCERFRKLVSIQNPEEHLVVVVLSQRLCAKGL